MKSPAREESDKVVEREVEKLEHFGYEDPPAHRDIAIEQIPVWQGDGVWARVIAGEVHDVAGAVQCERAEPLYLDSELRAGKPAT